MAPFSHLSPSPLPLTTLLTTPPHHSPSPLHLTTPPHHSDHTHPSSHHSPLSLLFTPLTPIHTNALPPLPHYSSLLPLASLHPLTTPVTTPSRYPSPLFTYPPHHTSSPPSSPLSSSPTFLTTHLFTTLFTPHPTTLKGTS